MLPADFGDLRRFFLKRFQITIKSYHFLVCSLAKNLTKITCQNHLAIYKYLLRQKGFRHQYVAKFLQQRPSRQAR